MYKECQFSFSLLRHGLNVMKSEDRWMHGQHLSNVSLAPFGSKWCIQEDAQAYGYNYWLACMSVSQPTELVYIECKCGEICSDKHGKRLISGYEVNNLNTN